MLQTAKTHSQARSGVTLIELLVAIAIFSVIMGGVMLMFTSVTNTVRRSYATMDVYERARGALLSVERDVQVAFAAPAAGASIQFYGEPHGFILIGIAPDQTLGRLTYAVHRDTARMDEERGERITLPRIWSDVAKVFPDYNDLTNTSNELSLFYPDPRNNGESENTLIDFEVEVVYGLLLRYYETDVQNVERFETLETFVQNGMLPRPALFSAATGNEVRGAADRFPWLNYYLFKAPDTSISLSVPPQTLEIMKKSEACHYWLQLLHGPGLRPIRSWNMTDIWWQPFNDADQFWYDPNIPWGTFPDGVRRLLKDYVVADNFVLETYLLDPATGQRIVASNGQTVPVVGPNPYIDYSGTYKNFDPIFRYAVENKDDRVTMFNTLYNLDHYSEVKDQTGTVTDSFNAFQRVAEEINNNPGDPDIELSLSKMTEARQFYDTGNPLQTRLPATFDITFWVLNEPGVPGAPPDLYRFSQTIQIPSGFMRRSRSVN